MQAQVAHLWCPEPDSNRHGRLRPRDFKSLVSTTFTIRATRTTAHAAGRCARERVPRKLTVLRSSYQPVRDMWDRDWRLQPAGETLEHYRRISVRSH